MNKAEKLLNSLATPKHMHDVCDTDVLFEIDPFDKTITSTGGQKSILVQDDHNSEIFTFKIPRYIEGHDMLLCDLVRIPYINSEVDTRNPRFATGVYTSTDLKVYEKDPDYLTFSWKISKNATVYPGTLAFMVVMLCMDGIHVLYRFGTDAYEDVYVLERIDAELSFENEYIDIIEQWKESVKAEFTAYIDAEIDNHAAVVKSRLSDEFNVIMEAEFAHTDDVLDSFNDILMTEITNMDSEIDVLKARMNTFSALGEGSTTGDAELADIRVGSDGTTYANAGEAVRTQISELNNKIELVEINPVFNKYIARTIGPGYLSKSVEPFATSDEIIIPKWAKTVVLDGMIGNSHVPQCLFISGEECVFAPIDQSTLYNYVYCIPANDVELNDLLLDRMIIEIPEGAVAFMVSNNTDRGGTVHPFKAYYKDDRMDYVETLHEDIDAVEQKVEDVTEAINNQISVHLPDRYSLVVGDTFELFFKGIIKSINPLNYDIRVSCDNGNTYRRKYIWTPSADDIGTHSLKIDVYNDSGAYVGGGATELNVVPKLTDPVSTKVLCIGDSLTAGGEWVSEVTNRLNKDGVRNIEFVGRKGVQGARFEATGGWFYNSYLALSTENPFFNAETGEIDFENYMFKYGNGLLDVCVILLGWNGSTYSENIYKNRVTSLIDLIRADYPNVKILLFGVQVPSRDGLGENYGCSWKYMPTIDFVFNLDKWYADISNEYSGIRAVNISGQFDTDYNMPSEERAVNIRNNTTEIVGTNGVHPALSGYYQIADVAYRELTALLRGDI